MVGHGGAMYHPIVICLLLSFACSNLSPFACYVALHAWSTLLSGSSHHSYPVLKYRPLFSRLFIVCAGDMVANCSSH